MFPQFFAHLPGLSDIATVIERHYLIFSSFLHFFAITNIKTNNIVTITTKSLPWLMFYFSLQGTNITFPTTNVEHQYCNPSRYSLFLFYEGIPPHPICVYIANIRRLVRHYTSLQSILINSYLNMLNNTYYIINNLWGL